MKNFASAVFIFTCILLEAGVAYSQVKVISSDVDFIEVIYPVDGIILWMSQSDTVFSNEKNEFLFKKKISEPQLAKVKIGNKLLRTILLPNKTVQIVRSDSSYQFVGDNSAGMKFLNQMATPLFTFQEAEKFKSDTTVPQIKSRILKLKQKDMEVISDLSERKEIDEVLARILAKEVNYLYALRTQQAVLSTQAFRKPVRSDLLGLFENTLSRYPLRTDYKPEYWNEYAKVNLIDKPFNDSFAQKFTSLDSARKVFDEGRHHAFRYNHALAYDSQEIVEKVLANYLMTELKQGGHEKKLVLLYEDFITRFPNSNYTKYLKPEIDEVIEHYRKIAKTGPAVVEYMNAEDIKSLEELLKKVKGQKYYVDLWATWCGPCKEEFKFNEGLTKLLQNKGYKKLYISLDKQSRTKKWKQDIDDYNLIGLHVIANKELASDISQNHAINLIPYYLIVDESGAIAVKNAPGPSNLKELEKLL